MKIVKSTIKRKIYDTIETMIDSEMYEWPPQCFGLAYQPERPNKIITEPYDEEINK